MALDYQTQDTLCMITDRKLKEKLTRVVAVHGSSVSQWLITNFGPQIVAKILADWDALPESVKALPHRIRTRTALGAEAPASE